MGSLTQSAMLLVNDQNLTVDYLTVLQSTSPSYLLMGSLDASRRQWSQEGRQIADRMLEISDNFWRNVKNIKGISCIDEESITSSVLAGFDRTKLLLNSWDIGLNGFNLPRN
jgi:arginine/lysine/ornithine decarboxylase